MDVFHYVAHQLRRIALFESTDESIYNTVGAVYNDFDFDSRALLNTEAEFCYSQFDSRDTEDAIIDTAVPNEAVVYAILEADVTDNNLYEILAIDHELVDLTSALNDVSYMMKVREIAMSAWEDIWLQLSIRAIEVFEMRYSIDWMGTDSVYDA